MSLICYYYCITRFTDTSPFLWETCCFHPVQLSISHKSLPLPLPPPKKMEGEGGGISRGEIIYKRLYRELFYTLCKAIFCEYSAIKSND